MSYSFLYTAAALLGLVTPMDQALMAALETPAAEREGKLGDHDAFPPPPALPFRPPGGEWRMRGGQPKVAESYTVHLASYLGETWAHRGWGEMVQQAPPLAQRVANFRHAEVPSLGPVVRVTLGRYKTLQEATAECANLRRYLEYCAPLALHETE